MGIVGLMILHWYIWAGVSSYWSVNTLCFSAYIYCNISIFIFDIYIYILNFVNCSLLISIYLLSVLGSILLNHVAVVDGITINL